jgi:nucleoside-diphosphate-sugar epimerase
LRVLVTGGAGFIGSHLVERLARDGHDVRVLDNFATGSRENLSHRADEFELIEGDIRSYERVNTAIRGCDAVLHQAALPSVPRSVQDPLTTSECNVTGTLNVLLAARDAGVHRVVLASSSSVYGPSAELPKNEDLRPEPISPYAVTKLAAEGFCRAFHSVYGLETASLRYFNVFGPRQDPLSQYAAVIPNFISAALDGRRPTVYGDGEQSRDFTYVDNVAEATVLAMSEPRAVGQVMNVACGERITINRVVAELERLTGRALDPVRGNPRPGEVKHSQADISRASNLLGFSPRIRFADGLARTVEHVQTGSRSK